MITDFPFLEKRRLTRKSAPKTLCDIPRVHWDTGWSFGIVCRSWLRFLRSTPRTRREIAALIREQPYFRKPGQSEGGLSQVQLSGVEQVYLFALARAVKILAGIEETVLGSEWWAYDRPPVPADGYVKPKLPLVGMRAPHRCHTKSIFGIPQDETASDRRRRLNYAKVDAAFKELGFRPPNYYKLVRLRRGRPRRKLSLTELRAQVAARVRKCRALRREQARAAGAVNSLPPSRPGGHAPTG